jgi:hypothetical protein
MINEIFIGIAGLILLVLTYFAGVWRTERRYRKLDKKDRLDAVLNKYMDFRHTNYTSGLDGLQKAGIAILHTDSEIRELVDRIIAHGEKNPLGSKGLLDSVDLKIFFDYAAKKGINFHMTRVEEIIKESGV